MSTVKHPSRDDLVVQRLQAILDDAHGLEHLSIIPGTTPRDAHVFLLGQPDIRTEEIARTIEADGYAVEFHGDQGVIHVEDQR